MTRINQGTIAGKKLRVYRWVMRLRPAFISEQVI